MKKIKSIKQLLKAMNKHVPMLFNRQDCELKWITDSGNNTDDTLEKGEPFSLVIPEGNVWINKTTKLHDDGEGIAFIDMHGERHYLKLLAISKRN